MYRNVLKRVGDVVVSLLALVLLLPILLILIVLLFLANNGKPFFFQRRPGKNEKIFTIIKLKTMNDKKDESGNLLPNTQRITKIGKFIRKTSLDEIMQLFNVIKGDMSIVGPRPLLIDYLSLYNSEQKKRHDVKPGITGWAQVNGRNAISWEEKFSYDLWYVRNINFATDLRIILKTLEIVFKNDGVMASEERTMKRFTGTPE